MSNDGYNRSFQRKVIEILVLLRDSYDKIVLLLGVGCFIELLLLLI